MKKMKVIAVLAFLLNTTIIGSYYSVAKEVLNRVDPVIFTFLQMMTLVLPGLFVLAFSWRRLTRQALKGGFMMGSCLVLGLFTLSIALKHNSATGTAFFPALNGLLAAVFAWVLLRQPITKVTWFAGLVSVAGAVLLMMNASMDGTRGTLIAFIGGLFCTAYIFVADHEQKDEQAQWALLGVELLSMALWGGLVALLFGDWQTVRLDFPKDGFIILYVGLGTTLLPTLVTLLLQKYISPVTVSFIYVLEPIMGALAAYLYLREVFPLDGYVGGLLIVAGALINTWGTLERPSTVLRKYSIQARFSGITRLLLPFLGCAIGCFTVYQLGGFPPLVWRELPGLLPQLPHMMQQGQGLAVFLLLAEAFSWLLAWVTLLIMGALGIYRVGVRLFGTTQQVQLDMRTLRQMGYTPYTMGAAREGSDKPLVQRRRQKRRERLIRPEQDTFTTNALLLPDFHVPHQQYLDVDDQRISWDDIEMSKVRER